MTNETDRRTKMLDGELEEIKNRVKGHDKLQFVLEETFKTRPKRATKRTSVKRTYSREETKKAKWRRLSGERLRS